MPKPTTWTKLTKFKMKENINKRYIDINKEDLRISHSHRM